MAGTGNASMKSPEPSWGRPLLAADEEHLGKFDNRRRKERRLLVGLFPLGLALLAAGIAFGGAMPPKIGGYVAFGGFIMALAGPYGLFRTSFALNRMFGLYEEGFVPAVHYKQGWNPFTRWAEVRAVYSLQFPRGEASSLGRAVRFVVRFEDHRGFPHHIRERDLSTYFGYTEAECVKILEEVLAVIRVRLPQVPIQTEHAKAPAR